MDPVGSDDDLFELARRELFVAVVGDVMDAMGLLHQFLPPEIVPLRDDMVVLGRALPVLEADLGQDPGDTGDTYGLMFRALDDLRPREVYLCAGSSLPYALWGELMSIRAGILGVAGAVLDGYSRDTRGILRLGFPTFSRGRHAQDQGPRGRVVDFRVPVTIGAVRVTPGDIVFGDLDGVCIVPAAATEEVFARALEKVRGERHVQQALEAGMGAAAAFKKFGIM